MGHHYNRIGIMCGRLSEPIGNKIQSFPTYSWKDEFSKARTCGFELIEWIFDLHEQNPLLHDTGIQEIKTLSTENHVTINSVCADYFMEKKLFNVSEYDLEKNIRILKDLILKCHSLGIQILEIPLVDSSSIKNKNHRIEFVCNLQKILSLVEKNDILLTLETDLPPRQFKELLLSFEHPNIKANYDTGNSASQGYDPQEELMEYGSWIANIHIKDRKYNGSTVPLGTGNANFDLFFSLLAKINYKGDLIIQGARELNSKITPEQTCKKYLDFTKQYIDKYLQ